MHIFLLPLWLLSSSLLMMILSPTVCIDGEPTPRIMLVCPSLCSSSTASGGPNLGSWIRAAGSVLLSDAPSVSWHSLLSLRASMSPFSFGSAASHSSSNIGGSCSSEDLALLAATTAQQHVLQRSAVLVSRRCMDSSPYHRGSSSPRHRYVVVTFVRSSPCAFYAFYGSFPTILI